jgi:hypothetical protein
MVRTIFVPISQNANANISSLLGRYIRVQNPTIANYPWRRKRVVLPEDNLKLVPISFVWGIIRALDQSSPVEHVTIYRTSLAAWRRLSSHSSKVFVNKVHIYVRWGY